MWKNSSAEISKVTCSRLGRHGKFTCGCPLTLAYTTVDWNVSLLLGNPVASQIVKAFTMEQLPAVMTPRQATPLFPAHPATLMNFIKRQITVPGISPTNLFVLARDFAMFPALFFSTDFSLVKTQEILRLPGNQGF